ncbi:MAG: hypothetical protein O7D96_00580 [SAR324 cluster bacterium]|nr:hypothetical protein [SAR324 cluster bacterium]
MKSRWRKPLGTCVSLITVAVLAMALASCEEDTSVNKPNSDEQAGIDAAGAVGSALENALAAEDQNPDTLQAAPGVSPSQLARLSRGLPGLGLRGAILGALNEVQQTGSASVTWDASYGCTGGGTVEVSGSATWSATWDSVEPVFYDETFMLDNVLLTLTDCSEDGYTLNGTATFTATNSFNFTQTAVGSSLFDIGLEIDESAAADITALQQATGSTFTLIMSWAQFGTLTGQINVVTEEATITSVDFTATITVNGTTCTARWTNPNKEPTYSCQ